MSELAVVCYIDEHEAKTVGMPDENGEPFETAVSKSPVSRHDVALVLKSAADAAIAATATRDSADTALQTWLITFEGIIALELKRDPHLATRLT